MVPLPPVDPVLETTGERRTAGEVPAIGPFAGLNVRFRPFRSSGVARLASSSSRTFLDPRWGPDWQDFVAIGKVGFARGARCRERRTYVETSPAPAADQHRQFVILVGGSAQQRASICHAACDEMLHVEPVTAAGTLSLRDLTSADVLVAWDNGQTIEDLKGQLSIIGLWCPIIAIDESPSTAKVVKAITAGAIEYVDWAGNVADLRRAIAAAFDAKSKMLPRKKRQFAARQQLRKLSRREHQVLIYMVQGLANKDISRNLQISQRTVEIHRANMLKKLEAHSSADAMRMALEASSATAWPIGDDWSGPWELADLLDHHRGRCSAKNDNGD